MIGPGSSKKRTKYFSIPLRGRGRADLPKPPQTVVALAPKVGSVGKHRSAVAAKPFCARNAAVSMCENRLPKSSRCVSPICIRRFRRLVWRCWFGERAQYRTISWRKSWMSVSRSQDGPERPVQCVKRLSPADDAMCEVTLGVIPVSLLRFAYDARSRCHSLVWFRRDGDSSFFSFPDTTETKPEGLAPPSETPGFPPKIRLPSNTSTIPIPALR